MHFLLEGYFGDFKQKPGSPDYWVFVTICYLNNKHLDSKACT